MPEAICQHFFCKFLDIFYFRYITPQGRSESCLCGVKRSVFAVLLPHGPQAENGGNEQDSHSDGTGNGQGMHAAAGEAFHFSTDGVVDGVIHTGTGDQREDGHHQVGNGGIFADASHELGIQRGQQGGDEVTEDVIAAEGAGDQINTPGKNTTGGTDENAGAVDIEDQ